MNRRVAHEAGEVNLRESISWCDASRRPKVFACATAIAEAEAEAEARGRVVSEMSGDADHVLIGG
jgi:hypothetical protein